MKKILLGNSLLLLLLIFCTYSVQSQNLTISSSGQTGTSGTNWSITGNTLTVAGTANIQASVIVNALNSGNLSLVGNQTTFAVTVSEAINSNTAGSGLTIGSTTNTGAIITNAIISIAGPFTAYGGLISLNANLSLTAANANILLKATSNINQAASTTVTTAGGAVNYWADSDDNSAGYVQLMASAAINSNGGAINLGGGTNLTTDFAFGTALENDPEANPSLQYISGVHLRSGSGLNSNGGNISIRGQNANISNAVMSFGVCFRGVTINSGTGKIAINGMATGSSVSNAQAVSSRALKK